MRVTILALLVAVAAAAAGSSEEGGNLRRNLKNASSQAPTCDETSCISAGPGECQYGIQGKKLTNVAAGVEQCQLYLKSNPKKMICVDPAQFYILKADNSVASNSKCFLYHTV